ncbi:glycosyltransferase [Kineococcus rhizosphaerae]|uniref:Glycosyl transferase family 2 n=1 Tax=Kineococcus rhizosphaerae TaxID=559628 RepID=A0A2T0R0W9_9ACTN|nr:glycosyltransferase [Kineococcus rhizosphaerae]PRY12940.1 glycosyl transferase family 2 [Kineococcus rhizosphaerae]
MSTPESAPRTTSTTREPATPAPFVDVVVPVKDDPRLVGCVQALLTQDHPADRFRVIVADNGSAAPRLDLADLDPRVSVVVETRPGSYAARNTAVRQARGDVLAFTDSDTLPDPSWLSSAVRALGSGADIVAGRVRVYPRDPARPHPVEAFEVVNAFRQDRTVPRGFAVTANVVVRREVFDAVGPFADALPSGGDAEWCGRAIAAGYRLTYVEDAVVAHPARESYAEAWRKLCRVQLGRQLRVRGGEDPPGALTLKAFAPPLGSLARAVRARELYGARARAAYVVGAFYMRYGRAAAAVKYR